MIHLHFKHFRGLRALKFQAPKGLGGSNGHLKVYMPSEIGGPMGYIASIEESGGPRG